VTTRPSPDARVLLGTDGAEAGEVWPRLLFALDHTQIAVAVWDTEDRLVHTNARFRELFAHTGPFDDRPDFATITERTRRFFRDDPVIEAAADERLHRRKRGNPTGEFLSVENRVIRFHDIQTPDGGAVTIYEDISRERSVEATLSALAKTLPGAIFELRRGAGDIACTYMSDRILELTGTPSEAFIADWGCALADLLAQPDTHRFTEGLNTSAEQLDELNIRLPLARPAGSTRWLRVRAAARRLTDGTTLWSGIFTDATLSVESTAALAQSERRFRDIIDIASDWVWETNAAGQITFVSDRFVEISGIPTDRIVGRTRRELPFYDWDDPGLQALEEDLRERRPIHGRRIRIGTPSGDRQVSLRGRPILGDDGTFQGYRGTGTDVTREHEYVQRLHDAMVEAQAANRAKSRFLANMSHDLRTPLNAIMGFSEIMQAEVFGPVGHPRYAEYSRDIRTSAVHLLELIDDLLDLARIESGRIEMVKEPLVIRDIVDEAIMLVAPRCEARGVSLTVTGAADAPVVHSDGRAVKQILVNLLTNASKFTERGGSIVVDIKPDSTGNVWVSVCDDGCGIPTAMIDEVTKPFVQASETASRPRDGVGLGLAIVRSLSEAIGAKFQIESRIGEGTTARVRLPSPKSA
jgi:PAS domain S-box-containing protein